MIDLWSIRRAFFIRGIFETIARAHSRFTLSEKYSSYREVFISEEFQARASEPRGMRVSARLADRTNVSTNAGKTRKITIELLR